MELLEQRAVAWHEVSAAIAAEPLNQQEQGTARQKQEADNGNWSLQTARIRDQQQEIAA